MRAIMPAEGSAPGSRIIHRHKKSSGLVVFFWGCTILLPPLEVRASRSTTAPWWRRTSRSSGPLNQPAVAARRADVRTTRGSRTRLRFKSLDKNPESPSPRSIVAVLSLLLLGAVAHDEGPTDTGSPPCTGSPRGSWCAHICFRHHRCSHTDAPRPTELLVPLHTRRLRSAKFRQTAERSRIRRGCSVNAPLTCLGHNWLHQLTQLAAQLEWLSCPISKSTAGPIPSPGGFDVSLPRPSSSKQFRGVRAIAGAGPATRRRPENQSHRPGNRTGRAGCPTVSNRPTALRMADCQQCAGGCSFAPGISSSRNNANHSSWVRSLCLGHHP